MKKLLGILVLGLLWCNVGFAELRQNFYKCTQIKTDSFGGSGKQKFHIYLVEPRIYKLDEYERYILKIKRSDVAGVSDPADDTEPLIAVGLLDTQTPQLLWYDIDNENDDPDPLLEYWALRLNLNPPVLFVTVVDITNSENKILSQLKKNARREMKLNKGSKKHNELEWDFLKSAYRITKKSTDANKVAIFSKYKCN